MMKAKTKFLFVIVTALAFLLAGVPVALADNVTININSSSGGPGYTFGGGVFTITSAGSYTITGTSTNTLAVADNIAGEVNLTLSGVQIDYYNIPRTPLLIGSNDIVNLILSGSNTLSARQQYSSSFAGIAVPSTTSLTISGDGSLAACGSVTGAGIGTTGLGAGSGGTITIVSGTVTATGGYNNSGNSNSGINGTIVINSGTVTATGGRASGGGSGSGLGGNVTINGGTVVANGGQGDRGGAGIGGSAGQGGGTITINGGTVTATGGPITEYSGAGIGGGYCGAGGNITINGGNITAVAGCESAGIGGGKAGLGGNITITNQNGDTYVSASGSGGAGIGCGYYISSNNTTSITITGGTVIADGRNGQGGAGIGGSYFCGSDVNQIVHITGGTVTATGGRQSAGIGGAYNGGGGTILISGGQVTATGGDQGAGIGCGYNWGAATNGGTITITGGTVIANGGSYGAGIGGGQNAAGGTITISGDPDTTSVTAVGGNAGAGIGNGEDQSQTAINGNGGTIEIDGGTVTATGGNKGAGIGGGQHSNAGTITIREGLVTASATLDAVGIGSGNGSTYSQWNTNSVTIYGGRVYATGSNTADIGGSYPGLSGSLNNNSWAATNIFNGGSIRAGSVNAAPVSNSQNLYKAVITVTNVNQTTLNETAVTYKVNGAANGIPTKTDDAGKLYLWFPQTPDGDVTTVEVDNGDTEYLVTGQVTPDNSAVMIAMEQTYEIATISDQSLDELTEGYTDGSQETIQITNTGTATLNNLSVSLGKGEDAYFDLTQPSSATLAQGASVDFTISAKEGLTADKYEGTVTVSADKMQDVTFQVTQSVRLIDVEFRNDGSPYASVSVHYNTSIGDNWPTDLKKTGYDYCAWFTVSGDQVMSDTPITQDLTLTPQWTPINYSISYDLEGGTIGQNDTPNPISYTIESNDIILTNPSKTGYDFVGWSVDGDDGRYMGFMIRNGSTGNMAFTANWTANAYTVAYNANGGTGTMNSDQYTYDVQKALTLNGYSRAGYTFEGWATDTNGPMVYGDNQNVKNLTDVKDGTVTLYAVWTRADYTIGYSLNGGAVSPANPAGYNVESDDITLHNPQKTGYTFVGWSGTGIPDNTMTVTISKGSTGNRSYTASWTANAYMVDYDANGGTGTMSPSQYTYDTPKTLTANEYSRAGYTFAGWSTVRNGPVVYIDKKSVENLTTDSTTVVLYAKWTVISYTIQYNLNSGTVSPANPGVYTVESSAITLKNPARVGYTFAGWTGTGISGSLTNVTIAAGSTGNRTYTANWTIATVPNYTIQAGVNNASYGKVVGSGTYKSGDTVKLTATPAAGCRFVKWMEGSATVSTSAVYSFNATKARTLTAYFDKIGTPAIQSCTSASYSGIKLTWSAVTGANGYYVYRSVSASGSYQKIATLGAVLAFTDTGRITGTTYYYKVQAYCVAGSVTTAGAQSAYKSAAAQLPKVSGLTLAKASATGVTVKWSTVLGESGYEVCRSTSAASGFKLVKTVTSATFTDSGLTKGKTYYYKVRAYRVVNGKKIYGAYSDVKSIKV